MKPEILEALSLRGEAMHRLLRRDPCSPDELARDPGLRAMLGADFREIARLFMAAADKIDPRPEIEMGTIMDLFR